MGLFDFVKKTKNDNQGGNQNSQQQNFSGNNGQQIQQGMNPQSSQLSAPVLPPQTPVNQQAGNNTTQPMNNGVVDDATNIPSPFNSGAQQIQDYSTQVTNEPVYNAGTNLFGDDNTASDSNMNQGIPDQTQISQQAATKNNDLMQSYQMPGDLNSGVDADNIQESDHPVFNEELPTENGNNIVNTDSLDLNANSTEPAQEDSMQPVQENNETENNMQVSQPATQAMPDFNNNETQTTESLDTSDMPAPVANNNQSMNKPLIDPNFFKSLPKIDPITFEKQSPIEKNNEEMNDLNSNSGMVQDEIPQAKEIQTEDTNIQDDSTSVIGASY
ncbi:MAG: hypothetical protein Q9M91_08955 [Candidatus Dojkabacteria bacterium]|nr:hypothetical protein [Candidatus Dojkabacteria bacterium]